MARKRMKASSWLQIEINTGRRKKRSMKSLVVRRRRYKIRTAQKLKLISFAILLLLLLVTAQAGQLSAVLGIGIIIVVGFYSIQFIIRYRRKQAILMSGIHKIDLMSGEKFERYLELLFVAKGYKVQRTPLTGDFGADLIICLNGINTAVQAKRYSAKVGLSAIQEVVGAMAHYSCKSGIVITNNYFTPQAKKLAESNNITLWERDELIQEILQLRQNNSEISEDKLKDERII